jgi:YD repeat-containing protein
MLRQSLAVLGILLALTGVVLGRSDIRYIYDELGRLVGVVDQNGDSAIYRYDAVGNVTSIVRIPAGQVSIIEFTPNQGPVGTAVIILGTAFGTTATENTVQFNGITASIIEASSTRLVVTVPAGASTGPISVTAPLGTGTSADSFSVSASSRAPTLTGFTPAVGIAGTAVTISGTNFELIASSNRLTFNRSMGVAAGATSISLSTTVPSNTGSGKISVSTPYGTATSTDDFFIPPSPYLPADVGFTSRVAPGESRTLSLPNPTKVGLVVFDSTAGNQVGIKFSAVTIGSSQVSILRPDGSYQLAPTSVGTAGRVVYSGSLPVNGTYTIFVDPDGSNVGSATLNLQTVNTAITMTPGSSVAGANMTAGWTAVPFPNGSDIVRMFTTGGVDTGKAQWTGGTASGSMSYSIPATTAAGSYQLRFYAENSTLLATSNTFTVTACTTASLSETPGTVVAGGSVAVTWSGVCAPNGSDIVRMFTTGGVNTGAAQWTGGTASGSLSFSIPAAMAAGSYQLRFYAQNSALLVTSNTFTVTTSDLDLDETQADSTLRVVADQVQRKTQPRARLSHTALLMLPRRRGKDHGR